ncbi:Uncharacterized membrane protein [Chitinophaga eiseniae]|uniref:Uncharacterized membrane protein n=1 Tax=Chitinophaga eiseniae TaxID=634771 RepID=A0A1T4ST31_9BACT|nr:vitamin K epoxide reductase family protein [Chitinophaga eiseniae]SKA31051.1 Uncharacterized membrane protein [Chitinophaga eiseniae]
MLYLLRKLSLSKNNSANAAFMLAKLLQVRISRSTLQQDVSEHPDYPSLLSISDCLKQYGIDNLTGKFARDKYSDLPTPFIAQLKGTQKARHQFVVVKEINQHQVRYYNAEQQVWETCSCTQFLDKSTGIALLAEAAADAGEAQYTQKIKQEKRTLSGRVFLGLLLPILLVAAFVPLLQQSGAGALPYMAFSLLTLTGTAICSLLIWYDIDQHNPLILRVCSAFKKTNCSAVLHSKGSGIFGVSWSAIGFTYFSGSLLYLLSAGVNNPAALFVLSWCSILAAPYILYSLYYQGIVVKQWCTLCLSVQVVIALQCLLVLLQGWHHFTAAPVTLLTLATGLGASFFAPFIVHQLTAPAILKSREAALNKREFRRLKYNRQIFEALLHRQRPIRTSTDGLGILLGNRQAAQKIVKVCSPFCDPCAAAFGPIKELIAANPDVQLQIIFAVTDQQTDARARPVSHFLAVDEEKDPQRTSDVLADWYLSPRKDYDAFAARHPVTGPLQAQHPKIAAMHEWCRNNGVQVTPTIFINGFELPENYQINDLRLLLSLS